MSMGMGMGMGMGMDSSSFFTIPPSNLTFLLLFFFLLSPHLTTPAEAQTQSQPINPKPSDTDALTIFRYRADAHGNLAANWSTPDACSGRWHGVGCNGGRVTSLSLPSLDLRGALDPLSHLDQLRLLDLHGNRLNGTLLPLLLSLPNLKLLYLSQNDISGQIPLSLGLHTRLLRLDIANNNLQGPIPSGAALSNLTRLLTLRLQNNLLSGHLPDLSVALPRLLEFNASNNQLYGRVPYGMRTKFGMESLAGNTGLCGSTPPLPPCQNSPPPSQSVVPSMPATSVGEGEGEGKRGSGRLRRGEIIGIVLGNVVFLLVLLSLLLAYCCCCFNGNLGEKDGKIQAEDEDDQCGRSSGDSYSLEQEQGKKKKKNKATSTSSQPGRGSRNSRESDHEGEAQSKLVFFEEADQEGEGRYSHHDDGSSDSSSSSSSMRRSQSKWTKKMMRRRHFGLEELLRASAEMLGKGSVGTVYRAVLEDGCMVAVKRLKDSNPCPRKEFHSYMDLIGRLRHPNLVPLRAYYYAKQEKLLIYDYLPNGSLYSLLHGNRGGPGRIPLDWTTRISLVLGAARGLAHIHDEYSSTKIPHGNIKSSNILLDSNGSACICDFGLALLLNPVHAAARLGGYRAPEQQQADGKRSLLSQEADVYGFGVLLLEVLTGRAPAQYPPPKKREDGSGIGPCLPEWVCSVVREEWTAEVFDAELMRYKNIEEEMVAMLHVGLACVTQLPSKRPTMVQVVKMIEDIRVEKSPLPEPDDDLNESHVSQSPSLPTEDGRPSY